MRGGREIWLRHVKYAARRVRGFIFFPFPHRWKISQCSQSILSHPKDLSLHIPSFLLYNQFDKLEYMYVILTRFEYK